LAAVIYMSVMAGAESASAGGMSADYIYCAIRNPHHTAPFVSLEWFAEHWLKGVVLTLLIGVGAWFARARYDGALRDTASMCLVVMAWLVTALGISLVDHDYVFAKFYLFRPSSIGFLLAFAVLFGVLGRWLSPRRLFVCCLVCVAVAVVPVGKKIERRLELDRIRVLQHNVWFEPFVSLLAKEQPKGVVLIEPSLETLLLSFERTTYLPTYVSNKFVPTSAARIQTWYARMQQRKAVFEGDCAALDDIGASYLMAWGKSPARACGTTVLDHAGVVLVKVE
jgi:hypothetical protein